MFPFPPICDEEAYDAALVEVEGYFDLEPAPGSPAADRFAMLLHTIADYEAQRWPIGDIGPVA
ncbi:hypothetical protein [Methylosinus sp. Sm6]|uniref:hypothetical protein n=1 Tax=Methylosinus sp. Sm6 TaxID=2866948 RepID=UPI001C9961FB|nr:hypothetical protein [Methylosinus sp. Sm6]MBY6240644.1 hypothetical protein [Methylosinus sp. Sm6]